MSTNVPAPTDDLTSLMSSIQNRTAATEQQLQGQSTAVPKQQSESVPMVQGLAIQPGQVPAQSGPFKVAPQQNGRAAQKRADMATLFNNVSNLVQTAAKNHNQRQLLSAENNWSRLMTAMQNPNDPQNQHVIQAILGDPKTLKQMSKALNIDWLNPAKGSDNIYRQALQSAANKHQLKGAALDQLKQILSGHLNSDQQKQLASQMAARFPKQPEDVGVLKNKLLASVYQKLLTDPQGVDSAVSKLSDTEKQMLGIGPSADAVLKASVDTAIAHQEHLDKDEALKEHSAEFEQDLNDRIAARTQQQVQFNQNQTRLTTQAQQTFKTRLLTLQVDAKRLDIEAQQAKTAAQRASIEARRADYQKKLTQTTVAKGQLDMYNSQLNALKSQLSDLTRQEASIRSTDRAKSTGLFSTLTGEQKTTLTEEGVRALRKVQDQIQSIQKQQTDIMNKENDIYGSVLSETNNDLLKSVGSSDDLKGVTADSIMSLLSGGNK